MRLFCRLSTKHPHTVDKEFYQCTAAISYILNYMCTAAYNFIKDRMRPYSCRLCTL